MTTYKKGEEYLSIELDIHPQSPLEWDNLGVIATWHNNYAFGDDQPEEDPQEYQNDLPKGTVILPVYMYEHSSISLQTKPFPCIWDSGQLGFIYATLERIEELGVHPKDVIKQLQAEIKTYGQYVVGEVYGFRKYTYKTCETCKHQEEVLEDSCWGFFGYDHEASGLLEAAGVENLDEWEEQ